MESCDHIICDHNNLTENILLLLDGLKVSHFLGAHGIFQNSLFRGKNPIELLVNWLAGLGILFSPNHSDRLFNLMICQQSSTAYKGAHEFNSGIDSSYIKVFMNPCLSHLLAKLHCLLRGKLYYILKVVTFENIQLYGSLL